MSCCRILVWEWGQRWQQPLGKRFISLIPSCRSSGGASSSSVLEGRWDSAGDDPQGQCCPGDLEAQPDPLQHDPWPKGGGNSAICYVVEMHLLLYILGESFYQQYTTRSVFCQWLGGCLQDQACEAQSRRGPVCFGLGICVLHMHLLFTHARPEEWRFVAHPGSKVTWTTNREEAEGLVKSGH